jgi:hypothetical protein
MTLAAQLLTGLALLAVLHARCREWSPTTLLLAGAVAAAPVLVRTDLVWVAVVGAAWVALAEANTAAVRGRRLGMLSARRHRRSRRLSCVHCRGLRQPDARASAPGTVDDPLRGSLLPSQRSGLHDMARSGAQAAPGAPARRPAEGARGLPRPTARGAVRGRSDRGGGLAAVEPRGRSGARGRGAASLGAHPDPARPGGRESRQDGADRFAAALCARGIRRPATARSTGVGPDGCRHPRHSRLRGVLAAPGRRGPLSELACPFPAGSLVAGRPSTRRHGLRRYHPDQRALASRSPRDVRR